jgi:hypothetical protein
MGDHSKLQALALLIDDDANASSFQSLGQYRTALLATVKRLQAAPAAFPVLVPVMESKAALEIQAARLTRELEHEQCGYKPGRDDAYTLGEMILEAAAYLVAARGRNPASAPRCFPWDPVHWPVDTARGYLVKAAALCRDELERQDRAAQVVAP